MVVVVVVEIAAAVALAVAAAEFSKDLCPPGNTESKLATLIYN